MNLTPADIRKALLHPHDPQLASPDAHLLTLRNALLEAWEEEVQLSLDENADWEAATNRGGALARWMIEKRAHTIEGLQAKAIAVAYCQAGDNDSEVILDDQQTTDVRLAQSIIGDLLGLAE